MDFSSGPHTQVDASGTWSVSFDDSTHTWKPYDGTNPSQNDIDDMYAMQQRIDAGEEVVIPEKKQYEYYNQMVYGTGGTITTSTLMPMMVDSILNPNLLITTNPVQKNAINKYTGKKMKYSKGKHGRLHGISGV